MPQNLSKKISKFFRVGVEGATTDGRNIDRNWIIQMAKNFDQKTYGARIWLEHLRGTLPDGPFRAYGDIMAAKTEEVEIKGEKKLALSVQIAPTEDLIAMVQKKQKIYTSMEVDTNFAKTGEAYLVGLGVTDSPASLGTEMLAFASQKDPDANPFTGKKQRPENLFSEAVEVTLEFEEKADHAAADSLLGKAKELFSMFKKKEQTDDKRFDDVHEAFSLMMDHAAALTGELKQAFSRIDTLESELKTSNEAFSALKHALEQEEGKAPARPESTGGSGDTKTDC